MSLIIVVARYFVRQQYAKAVVPGVLAIFVGWFFFRYIGSGVGGYTTTASGEIVPETVFFLQEIPYNNFWLMVILIWIQVGFSMVILSAAIKAVPDELLEALQQLEQGGHLLRRDPGDGGAAIGHQLDPAVERQHLQGLAQGGAADAKFFGNLQLVDPAAWLQLACKDALAQQLGHFFVQGAGGEGQGGHGLFQAGFCSGEAQGISGVSDAEL